jgi:hypothetical protein
MALPAGIQGVVGTPGELPRRKRSVKAKDVGSDVIATVFAQWFKKRATDNVVALMEDIFVFFILA